MRHELYAANIQTEVIPATERESSQMVRARRAHLHQNDIDNNEL
jgi:hypothetical protein